MYRHILNLSCLKSKEENRNRLVWCVVLANLFYFSSHTLAAVSVDDVIAAQSAYFSRIHSLDLCFSVQISGIASGIDTTDMKHPPHTSQFRLSGQRYRVDTFLDCSPPGAVLAFDLKSHQSFDPSRLALTVRTSPSPLGYMQNIPVLQNFEPVIPNVGERTFDALGPGAAAWTDLSSVAKMEDAADFGGHPCFVLSIFRNNIRRYRWYFATDLNVFPIGYESYHEDGKVSSKYLVEEPSEVDTQQGKVVIPMKATWDWYAESGDLTLHHQFVIDPSLLKVNQDIDDGIFTLDRSVALSIADVDNPSNNYNADRAVRHKAADANPVDTKPTDTSPLLPDSTQISNPELGSNDKNSDANISLVTWSLIGAIVSAAIAFACFFWSRRLRIR